MLKQHLNSVMPVYWIISDLFINLSSSTHTHTLHWHLEIFTLNLVPMIGTLVQQPPKQKLLTILIYNSHPILMQFSCNNRWDFQKCPCNSHLQFSSNSHQTILIQFSPNSHLQFSSNSHLTILIQFSPDNSHPIFTWQFSSNSHLQFSLNSHQHCSVNSHQQCSANFLVMISQSVLISHAAIFIQCWFYNGSE